MSYHSKIYLVLAALLQVIDSLSNLSVRIPEYIQKGQTADLTCSFNLGGDKLYSVKWYKGRHEFYRYMPNENPVIKTFPVKGMIINMTDSTQSRVLLEQVQVRQSGTYLCEVTVTPSYYALMQYANMTVVDLPEDGPNIDTPRKQYQVGETADLMCTARPSNPPTQLSWYINGEPANDAYLRRYTGTKQVPEKLGLSFPVTSNHFVKNNRVRLKCLASISQFYWKSGEITLLQEKPKFASVMTSGDDVPVEKSEVIASGASRPGFVLSSLTHPFVHILKAASMESTALIQQSGQIFFGLPLLIALHYFSQGQQLLRNFTNNCYRGTISARSQQQQQQQQLCHS